MDDTSRKTKLQSDFLEKAEAEADVDIVPDPASELSEPHRAYLLQRHGTLDLEPLPSMDPADPYNWALWKVLCPYCVEWPGQQLKKTENSQPRPGGIPRLHGHLHCSRHHRRVRRHRGRPGCVHPKSQLPHLLADRYTGRRPAGLETALAALRTAADLPCLAGAQLRV